MRVLVLGPTRPPHLGGVFRSALEHLGHQVRVVEPEIAYTALDRWPFRKIVQPLLGNKPSGRAIFRRRLLDVCRSFQPEVILSTGGTAMDMELIHESRRTTGARLVLYCSDNPFNPYFLPILEALSAWDLVATPRKASLTKLRERCRGEVVYTPFAYDPGTHYPEPPSTDDEQRQFRSDAVFMGGCDRDRVPFLDLLARAQDLTVALYGGYYRYTPALRQCHRGLAYGRDYRLALGGAEAAICLVRRANEDGHVMRTFEIPACAAFMVAERTDEHCEFFREDRDAVFFSTPEELVDKVRYYHRHPALRRQIASNGYNRVVGSPNTYADRLSCLFFI